MSESSVLGLFQLFGEHFVEPGLIEVEYAKLIAHAFDSRNDGDYDVAFVATRALAEAEFKDAAKFVNRIEQYFGSGWGITMLALPFTQSGKLVDADEKNWARFR